MSLQAVLGNPEKSGLGTVTIQLPIPRGQYTECIEKLEALGIGDAVKADCEVNRIDGTFPHLGMLEISSVNIEDLNYLAKRLESFSGNEVTQFLAVAYDQELYMTKPLINLTFCCQQVTVITNFNDLEAIGRRHHINLQGSSESNKLETFSDYEAALILINEKSPDAVTPYGVLYENGMRLTEVYDGQYFPCYFYEPNPITVAVISKAELEDTKHIVWLYLPMEQKEIDRALLHAGITDPSETRLRLEDSQLPNEVNVRLDMQQERISDLNDLAQAVEGLSEADLQKLGAAAVLAEPKSAVQIKNLAEHLDLFDFAPGAHSPTEYGKYMIQKSGCFEYDENLDAFYNYEGYALQRMAEEEWMFTDRGYIAYKGDISMEEVMDGSQNGRMEMGGLT